MTHDLAIFGKGNAPSHQTIDPLFDTNTQCIPVTNFPRVSDPEDVSPSADGFSNDSAAVESVKETIAQEVAVRLEKNTASAFF